MSVYEILALILRLVELALSYFSKKPQTSKNPETIDPQEETEAYKSI